MSSRILIGLRIKERGGLVTCVESGYKQYFHVCEGC